MDDPRPENLPGGRKQGIAQYAPFLTLGIQLAISIVFFLFVGRWLDGRFNTTPWLTLAGAALGIAGGMMKFIKSALDMGKRADEENKETRRGGRRED